MMFAYSNVIGVALCLSCKLDFKVAKTKISTILSIEKLYFEVGQVMYRETMYLMLYQIQTQ